MNRSFIKFNILIFNFILKLIMKFLQKYSILLHSFCVILIVTKNYNFDFVGFAPSRYLAFSAVSAWTLGIRSFYMSNDNKYMIVSYTSPSATV